ncbi:6252_t:CDS:1, partial [Racocetra persica]
QLKKKKLEAPPLPEETTSNLQTPEVLGQKLDKRTLRKTGRTEQFATRVSKE